MSIPNSVLNIVVLALRLNTLLHSLSFREHPHLGPEERLWGLSNVDRVDVHQADVCALMSALLGTPFPVNSHGIIPLEYIDGDGKQIGGQLTLFVQRH